MRRSSISGRKPQYIGLLQEILYKIYINIQKQCLIIRICKKPSSYIFFTKYIKLLYIFQIYYRAWSLKITLIEMPSKSLPVQQTLPSSCFLSRWTCVLPRTLSNWTAGTFFVASDPWNADQRKCILQEHFTVIWKVPIGTEVINCAKCF